VLALRKRILNFRQIAASYPYGNQQWGGISMKTTFMLLSVALLVSACGII